MRYGRIAKIQLLEMYTVKGYEPTLTPEMEQELLEELVNEYELTQQQVLDFEKILDELTIEQKLELIFEKSLYKSPVLKDNWVIIEEEDDELNLYKVTSKWREFVSDEIVTNDRLGEFPFNIVDWEHKYDFDLEMSMESSSNEPIDVDTDDLDNLDEDIDYDNKDIFEMDITLYNPPKNLVNEIASVDIQKRDGVNIDKENISDQPFRQLIIVKVGYYGKNGMNVPIIFRGDLDPERGVEYNEDGEESELVITAQSARELFDEPDDDDVSRGYSMEFDGERLDIALEKIVEGTGVTLGNVIYEYTIYDEEEDEEETKEIYVPEIKIEEKENIISIVDELIKEVNNKYDFDVEGGEGLKFVVEKGSVLSIVPINYVHYNGVELSPEIGLINFTKQKNVRDGTSESGKDENEYELETLFLPEISHGDLIKVKRSKVSKWEFYKVTEYVHDVPHNDSATTTMQCEKIEGVETIRYNESDYSLTPKSPYEKPVVSVR